VDATIVAKGRFEVRGGTLTVARGKANREQLEIGPETQVVGRNEACDLVLDDRKVSAVHMELVATERGVRVRDLGSRNGTSVGDTRIGEVYLTKKTTITCGDSVLEFNPTTPEQVSVSEVAEFGPLVGSSAAMRAVFERLRKAAPTELTVLIGGETGTGKELVAQAIHQASSRAHKPFVVVDCGSIPPSLAESALFGHERGSFTGAVDKRISPFAEADGGTIFLDELGELPVDVQPKLLRALAEQRIKSVGSNTYRPVNVRVLAATRRDLVREVNAGNFRSDLYFRVAQLKVELPALRNRLEDLPALIRRMMADFGGSEAYDRITHDSLERLMRHDWPGNVRELRNVLERAIYMSQATGSKEIGVVTLPTGHAASDAAFHFEPEKSYRETRAKYDGEFEKRYVKWLLGRHSGNISAAAREAKMDRKHLHDMAKKHGLRGNESDE